MKQVRERVVVEQLWVFKKGKHESFMMREESMELEKRSPSAVQPRFVVNKYYMTFGIFNFCGKLN